MKWKQIYPSNKGFNTSKCDDTQHRRNKFQYKKWILRLHFIELCTAFTNENRKILFEKALCSQKAYFMESLFYFMLLIDQLRICFIYDVLFYSCYQNRWSICSCFLSDSILLSSLHSNKIKIEQIPFIFFTLCLTFATPKLNSSECCGENRTSD